MDIGVTLTSTISRKSNSYFALHALTSYNGNMTTQRIGFNGQWRPDPSLVPSAQKEQAKPFRYMNTTVASFRKLSPMLQYSSLMSMIVHNCRVLRNIIELLGSQPEATRMYQIPSDILPFKGLKEFNWIYSHYTVIEAIESGLSGIRTAAQTYNVRLFMQARPFTNISSANQQVADESIADIEHHTHMAQLMGFSGKRFPSEFCLIITVNTNHDPNLTTTFRRIYNGLSVHARDLIVVKNSRSSEIFDLITEPLVKPERQIIASSFPVVYDMHMDWVSADSYASARSLTAGEIVDSWKGHRPLIIFSQPDTTGWPASAITPHVNPTKMLINVGKPFSNQALARTSNYLWNYKLNQAACDYLDYADVLVEAKSNNLAQNQLYEFAKMNSYVN